MSSDVQPALRRAALASTELPLVTSCTVFSGQDCEIGRNFVLILLVIKDEKAEAHRDELTSQKLQREGDASMSLFTDVVTSSLTQSNLSSWFSI